jgi:hypothetical protein
MVEESYGLCHIQEGFIPTDIHLSYMHIAPAFKPGLQMPINTMGFSPISFSDKFCELLLPK